MKLRDVLLPKPFVGVVLWASVASVVTLYLLMPEPVQIVRPAPQENVIEVTAKPIASVAATAAADATRAAGDVPGNEEWPDRTHEIVTRVWPHLKPDDGLRLGVTRSTPGPTVFLSDDEIRVRVSKEDLAGGNLRIVVRRGNNFEFENVELVSDRANRTLQCAVRSGTHTLPQAPSSWSDVNGQVALSSWDWPSNSPLVLEYSLNGVRGGQRQCVHDRVVIDF
ncbi:MAG: hypothetical protein ACKVWV_06115 [Planctomycetota bacterium]